jgi:hypothetical protein
MERDQITHELKYYRSYKAAIESTQEIMTTENASDRWGSAKYESAAACRVTIYSDMPSGTGSGSRAPKLTGNMSFEDAIEYSRFQSIVMYLEMGMSVLTELELDIITFKWMDDLNLNQIAERKGFSYRTAKTIHGRALDKMYNSLRFVVYLPKVQLPDRVTVA